MLKRVPNAYILRPPYLYGSMNNVYREAFVFDCAMQGRKFYLRKDGEMKLQFFHVKDWVTLCYKIVGKEVEIVNVWKVIEQRKYFSFYDYEYALDVREQYALMPQTEALETGLQEDYEWYLNNQHKVVKRPYMEFIDREL